MVRRSTTGSSSRCCRAAGADLPRGELDDRADDREGVVRRGEARGGAALVVAAVELVDVLRDGVQRPVAAGHRARARADDLHQQRLRLVGELRPARPGTPRPRRGPAPRAQRRMLRSPAARIAPRITSIAASNKRDDAVLLVVEVLVERGLRHPGLARDRLRGGLGVADAREHGGGGGEQAAALEVLADLQRRRVAAAGGGGARSRHGSKGSRDAGHYPLGPMRRLPPCSRSVLAAARARRVHRRSRTRRRANFKGAEADVAQVDRRPQVRRQRDPEEICSRLLRRAARAIARRRAAATAPTRSTRCSATSTTPTSRSPTSRSPAPPPARKVRQGDDGEDRDVRARARAARAGRSPRSARG